MENIESVLEDKNPEDVTTRDLHKLQVRIEMSIRQTDKLQALYRKFTGRVYFPPIRLS